MTERKRKNRVNLEAKTRDWFRDGGWHYATTETYSANSFRRHDLFGFADAIAFRPGGSAVYLVQTTSLTNARSRIKKLGESQVCDDWLGGLDRVAVLVLWHQPDGVGRKWVPIMIPVTRELLVMVREGKRLDYRAMDALPKAA